MSLNKLRNQINKVDNQLIGLLAKRAKLSTDVAKIKIKEKIPVLNLKREKEVICRVVGLAKSKAVSSDLAKNIIKLVIEDSKKIQRRLLK